MKREIPVEQAVGMPLAHDLTRIVPGEFKGPVFHKGHIVREEDIPVLLDIGKRYIYVLELEDDELHENDGAVRMAQAIAGQGLVHSDVHEGKVVLKAEYDGMLWIDEQRLLEMNLIDDISITTRRPFIHVKQGTSVAGVRPIPLTVKKDKVERVEQLALPRSDGRKVIEVLPYGEHRVALVTTGSEILTGRIEDKFGPALTNKFAAYGAQVVSQVMTGDEQERIVQEIVRACEDGATIVCVTGGMSVDPDDRSPAAIRQAATEVVTYGTPMLPGSMLMLAYRNGTPVFGLPGAVIYDRQTSFDVLLPRVLAGIQLSKADVARHGAGGWLNE
ncbi:molybdopterin-binding protein [Alicyclobacillus tolerans]|uniref:molybdopterin-binding protein n=1 Tax=Alicyclobacillus tolerans TaxID=90970 RepID=UPI001F32A77F|nr:molybdopterin-binding protein [Alicyclobacillus tolerans]MCF8566347.1 molybdopterin-binding protein [Alicyclobacillus tolerans]